MSNNSGESEAKPYQVACGLITTWSQERVARIFKKLGRRVRKSGRYEFEVGWDEIEFEIFSQSPILLCGSIPHPDRIDEILAPLRAAGVPYTAECYDWDQQLLFVRDWGDGRLQFTPSRVEGLANVSLVTILPDRMELVTPDATVMRRWVDVARWPRPRLLWKILYHLGIRPRWLPVGERDWFHAPADRFFIFYTQPQLKVYMPQNELTGDNFTETYFYRLQNVLRRGGFNTFDLG